VLLQVQANHCRYAGPLVGIEVAAGGEVAGQRPGAVARPGAEGGDELVLVNQAVLKREQAEEHVVLGGDGGHGASLPGGRRERWMAPDARDLWPDRAGSDGLSHAGPAQAASLRLIVQSTARGA
jgi:hypothetical protein